MTETKLRDIVWNDAITIASPHPYVLATSVDAKGKPNIIGLAWWTICSWDPPMMLVSVGKKKYSRECIDAGKEFVVCLLGEEHAAAAWVCGTKGGRKIEKFKAAGFTPVPSKAVKPPTIGESLLAFECRVKQTVEAGDHILYVGDVVAIRGTGEEKRHLYSIHYSKLVALGPDGSVSLDLPFKG
jgi:flavin reductase (DIM6/NTAB) family NADH-FMN oxidoreductase RutF